MNFEVIIKELTAKIYHPIYLLYGPEPYYIDAISDFMEENILSEGEKAFNLITFYGKDTDFKTVVDEARQFPMMSNCRLIIVKEAQDMKTLQELVSYVEKPSPHSILVLCHKYKKIDKRTKFGKLLEERSCVFESKKLYDNEVPAWINTYLKTKGYSIDPKASSVIGDFLGADLSKISNELDKIILGLPVSQLITTDLVKEQIGISKDFSVFELQTALGEKNFAKANLIIKYFSVNPSANPAVLVIGSLFTYFNKVYITSTNQNENDNSLSRLLGLTNTYFIKEYRNAAKLYPQSHLRKIFQALKQADLHAKGVGLRSGDQGSIFKDILIACLNP